MFGSKSRFEVAAFLASAYAKGQFETLPISAIATGTGLSRPTVHQVLSELESLDLVAYETSKSDNRFKHSRPTQKFFQVAEQQLQPFLKSIDSNNTSS